MHQNFQQDLIRLRLTSARALVQTLSDQSGVGNEKEQIKLSAQVQLLQKPLIRNPVNCLGVYPSIYRNIKQ